MDIDLAVGHVQLNMTFPLAFVFIFTQHAQPETLYP